MGRIAIVVCALAAAGCAESGASRYVGELTMDGVTTEAVVEFLPGAWVRVAGCEIPIVESTHPSYQWEASEIDGETVCSFGVISVMGISEWNGSPFTIEALIRGSHDLQFFGLPE
jgi:hypothetical protein